MTRKIDPVDPKGVGNTKQPPKVIKQVKLCKNWCFTLNNYKRIDIDNIIECFKVRSSKYLFQEEIGENKTRHLQGVVTFKEKTRWTALKLNSKIHWEVCRNVKASYEYCQKEDTRNGEVFKFGFPAELKLIDKLRPWQSSIINIINEEVDDRAVYWIYDKDGCNGKTVFSKYLYAKYNAIIATGGGNKDIACLLALLGNPKHGTPRDLNAKTVFVFNFPRSTEGISFKAIESVKDGLMTSVKYESSTLVFNPPHVIVFSNELPEMDKLSKDRWHIYTINCDSELIKYKETIKKNKSTSAVNYDGKIFGSVEEEPEFKYGRKKKLDDNIFYYDNEDSTS